jgi:hypothetical protein
MGKPSMPEHSVVAAGLAGTGDRRRQTVEHDIIPVFPEVPKTQPPESRGGAGRNHDGKRAQTSVSKRKSRVWRNPEAALEGECKEAAKQQVTDSLKRVATEDSLKRAAADGAEALSRDKDLFLEKVLTHLDAPAHAEPGDEFHTRGSVTGPDKISVRSRDTTEHAETVESRAAKPIVARSAEGKGTAIQGGGEPDPPNESEERAELLSCSGREPGARARSSPPPSTRATETSGARQWKKSSGMTATSGPRGSQESFQNAVHTPLPTETTEMHR